MFIGSDYTANSSKLLVKAELSERIVFDDSNVFRRLDVSKVSDKFVDQCCTSFQQKYPEVERKLVDITSQAPGLCPETYTVEVFASGIDGKKIAAKALEREMYPHLVCKSLVCRSAYVEISTTLASSLRPHHHV